MESWVRLGGLSFQRQAIKQISVDRCFQGFEPVEPGRRVSPWRCHRWSDDLVPCGHQPGEINRKGDRQELGSSQCSVVRRARPLIVPFRPRRPTGQTSKVAAVFLDPLLFAPGPRNEQEFLHISVTQHLTQCVVDRSWHGRPTGANATLIDESFKWRGRHITAFRGELAEQGANGEVWRFVPAQCKRHRPLGQCLTPRANGAFFEAVEVSGESSTLGFCQVLGRWPQLMAQLLLEVANGLGKTPLEIIVKGICRNGAVEWPQDADQGGCFVDAVNGLVTLEDPHAATPSRIGDDRRGGVSARSVVVD